jgi:MoaA/NifB/PqqE/SkfB family radical SAM enzyme
MEKRSFGSNKLAVLVNGMEAKWISLKLFAHILFLAFLQEANPVKALQNFRKVAAKRAKIQGYKAIPRYIKLEGKYFFAEHIPGWPSGAFRSFFEAELLRAQTDVPPKPMLNTAIFSITSRCGLQCSHCFEWDNLDKGEHLHTGELLIILEKLKPLGLTHIQFGGGEPLVRFNDLLLLIENAKANMDCWILTSGFGLTREKALKLKMAGLKGASISLDHWSEEGHNKFRNHHQSYSWVKEAVKNCRDTGILVSLAFCARKEFVNRENLENYYHLAKEWGAGFIKILEARRVGRYKDKDEELDTEQIKLLIDFYLQSYTSPAWNRYPIVMYPGFDQRQVGCLGAGNRYLYIDSKGEIHACPFCHGSAGNATKVLFDEAIPKLRNHGCHVFHLSNS